MWEDTQKKTTIKNIILFLLILVTGGGLVYAMLYIHDKNAIEDENLSTLYVQQQQEQTEARQETVNTIQLEYEKDMETVNTYLPGIVCWGDDITRGSAGNASFPYVLQKYIDTYICDIYDFRSTIENAEEFSRLKWQDYKVNIPVVNMGAGAETSDTVLARSGAGLMIVKEKMTIPADKTPVAIKLISGGGNSVNPLIGDDGGLNPVVINGVEGTLTIDAENYRTYGLLSYSFTRNNEGEETEVPEGTVVRSSAADLYKDYVHVVCIGSYDKIKSAADMVAKTKQLLARQTNNSDRFIVLGIYAENGNRYSEYSLNQIDDEMQRAFGTKYINLRTYFIGDGLTDGNITKSRDDTNAIARNAVPPCFLTNVTNSLELNSKANLLVGRLIFNRMESLGYFDEIYSELGITDSTKELLKEDPEYFEKIIKNIIK